ncbi:MAG: hypothetical protein CVV29_10780 [Methanobacteriales archaeon HGW-Methanobacteriales-2]|nr:MAG: hypothetical protein CVV29_10780 [Methanobacteriales archaeon HGW-Methanobacteriales-2]
MKPNRKDNQGIKNSYNGGFPIGNIDDARESPAADVIGELQEQGPQIKVHDPYANVLKHDLDIFTLKP